MQKRVAAAVVVAAGLGLVACGSEGRGDANGRLQIATTVSPITSIVASVAGEHADVTGLVPEGVNSHEYEPRPSDVKVLADADVVYLNGLNLETPTRELAEKTLGGDDDVVELGSLAIDPAEYVYDFSFPRAGGDPNPHLWTSPLMGRRYAELVRDDLKRRDPAHAADYDRNAAALLEQLDVLDRAVRAASATVPSRILLTYHDSFPYFAREYGWRVIGAIQPADFSEPSAKEVGRLIEQVRETKVRAIFGSEVFPSPVLQQIARETGVRYVDDLRDDDLPGEPGDPEHSYVGLLRYDFVTMVEALGGDAGALTALDVGDDPDAEYAQ